MSKEIAVTTTTEKQMTTQPINIESMYSNSDLQALRKQYAEKLNDEQFRLYVLMCNRLALDPGRKHIYGIIRGGKLSIEVAIDGFRYIADRTDRYSPGNEDPIYDKNGKLIGAKVWVKKLVKNYMSEFYCIAFFDEYKPKNNDFMWIEKPFAMIAKCAEARALRKAFPNEFCGIYCREEMQYADSKENEEEEIIVIPSTISNAQMQEIKELVSYDLHIIKKIIDRFSVLKFSDLLASDFDIIMDYAGKLAISPLQLNQLANIVSSSKDPAKLEEYILKSHNIEKLIELNQKQYKKVITVLKQKQLKTNGDTNENSQPRAENA